MGVYAVSLRGRGSRRADRRNKRYSFSCAFVCLFVARFICSSFSFYLIAIALRRRKQTTDSISKRRIVANTVNQCFPFSRDRPVLYEYGCRDRFRKNVQRPRITWCSIPSSAGSVLCFVCRRGLIRYLIIRVGSVWLVPRTVKAAAARPAVSLYFLLNLHSFLLRLCTEDSQRWYYVSPDFNS